MPKTTLRSFKHNLASPLTTILCSLELLRQSLSASSVAESTKSEPKSTSKLTSSSIATTNPKSISKPISKSISKPASFAVSPTKPKSKSKPASPIIQPIKSKSKSKSTYKPIPTKPKPTPNHSLFNSLITNQDQHWSSFSAPLTTDDYLDIISASALEIKKHFELRDDPTSPESRTFSLKKVVTDIVKTTRRQYLVRIYSNINNISDRIAFYGHQANFQVAVQNIINNAIEAYQPGSVSRPVDLKIIRRHHHLKIIVIDHGRGMNSWQTFWASKKGFSSKKVKGGLGLWEARRIIQKDFSGKLTLSSARNHGTITTINLHYDR